MRTILLFCEERRVISFRTRVSGEESAFVTSIKAP